MLFLYTFVFEFRGGTYISQVVANDPKDAQTKWAQLIDYKNIWGMGPMSKKQLLQQLDDETPVAIKGMKNVWCSCVLLNGYFGLIHFIKTVNERRMAVVSNGK